jgi:YHS domain-containing protein
MSFLRKILGGEPPFVDPVCEMKLPVGHARDRAEYRGVTYHFCSTTCKEQFQREPGKYLVGEKAGSREES